MYKRLTFSRTQCNERCGAFGMVADVAVHERARPAGGRASELSGSEAATRLTFNVPRGAQVSIRQAGEDRQPICCRCCEVFIGSSAVQLG